MEELRFFFLLLLLLIEHKFSYAQSQQEICVPFLSLPKSVKIPFQISAQLTPNLLRRIFSLPSTKDSQISLNTEKRAHGTSKCLTENKQILYIQAKHSSSVLDKRHLTEFSQRWWWGWLLSSHCLKSTLTQNQFQFPFYCHKAQYRVKINPFIYFKVISLIQQQNLVYLQVISPKVITLPMLSLLADSQQLSSSCVPSLHPVTHTNACMQWIFLTKT